MRWWCSNLIQGLLWAYDPSLMLHIIKPHPTIQLFTGYFPITLCVITPPQLYSSTFTVGRTFTTLTLRCTALFAPDSTPSLPVLEFLSIRKSVRYCRPPPPIPALTVFPPPTFSPCPYRPLHPRSMSLFLMPLSPSVSPPFIALNVASITDKPCGWSIIGYVLPLQFPWPPPPLPASTCGWSLTVPRRVVYPFPGLLYLYIMLPPPPLLCHTISWFLPVVYICILT